MKPIHINMAITENTTRPTARPNDKIERAINLRFLANSIYAILTAVTNVADHIIGKIMKIDFFYYP